MRAVNLVPADSRQGRVNGGKSGGAAYAVLGPRFHRKFLNVPGGSETSDAVTPPATELPVTSTTPAAL